MAAPVAHSVSSDHGHERAQVPSQSKSRFVPHFFRSRITEEVLNQNFTGNGTKESPHIVDYLNNDHEDAQNNTRRRKWRFALLHSISTLVVTFGSSEYAPGISTIREYFHVSNEVSTLGLSLYVLGFAVGPLIWGPLSELYGRRAVYVVSMGAFTAFNIGTTVSQSIQSLVVLRFLASACGASTLSNTGGIISDLFTKRERGMATGLFVTAPFLGPALGPVIGGFVDETIGWRWLMGLLTIFGGVMWLLTSLVFPETYAPVILRSRAKTLSSITGKVYVSRPDAANPPKTLAQELRVGLLRPWILLFREPIVFLMSLYMAIVYGTLYMFFAAIPIVFEYTRGWSKGRAGLPFVAVVFGVLLSTVTSGIFNKRYQRICAELAKEGKQPEPEIRLVMAKAAALILPIGLFIFAWTTYPSIPWIAPVIGALIFAWGLVLIFISQMVYLIDSYTIYAASVLAAGSVARSVFGTAFPLFTSQMYEALGNQWASSIPAFLVLACVPIPFLFSIYGPKIRSKCKFAAEAARVAELMRYREGAMVNLAPKRASRNVEDEPDKALEDETDKKMEDDLDNKAEDDQEDVGETIV